MISNLAHLGNLLLASGALALDSPSSLQGTPLARLGESLQSLSLSGVESPRADDAFNIVYSTNSAGAMAQGDPSNGENITYVTGTFIVPTPLGDNSSVMILVGLDGTGCQTGALLAGIEALITDNVISFKAWYQYLLSTSHAFPGISVSAGDTIRVSIAAISSTLGVVMMDNLSTDPPQGFGMDVSLEPRYFCMANAMWMVDGLAGSTLDPFDNVSFSAAMATGTMHATYTPSGPASAITLFDVLQNERVLTHVDTNGSSLFVQRLSS